MKYLKTFLILLLTPLVFLFSISFMICFTAMAMITHIFTKKKIRCPYYITNTAHSTGRALAEDAVSPYDFQVSFLIHSYG